MITISLDDFLSDGILIESKFREKIAKTDWKQYKDEKVLIKGCTSAPVPTWAYLIVASNLTPIVKKLYYGESCSAIPIFKKH